MSINEPSWTAYYVLGGIFISTASFGSLLNLNKFSNTFVDNKLRNVEHVAGLFFGLECIHLSYQFYQINKKLETRPKYVKIETK